MFYDNGYVRLVDLSGDKNIYVNLYKRYKITLCKSIITKHKSLYSIERKISENGLYSFFYKNQKIKLTTLIKMVKFLKINMDLEKVVCEIGTKTGKSIINPNFPFNFNSSEGFRIISAIFGDGGISKKEIFSYYNYDLNLINGLIKSVIKVFGNVDYKFIQSGEGYQLNFPSIVAKILLCCGIKKGDKTINNPRIPEFIKEGNKKNKIVFLKQITDDDGSAQINAPYSYSVRYEFSINSSNKKESNIAKDLRYILVGLGYNTSKVYSSKEYKCKSKNLNGYSWAFDVQGKHTLEKFQKEIGFSIKTKKEKLRNGIKRMKKNQLGSKKMYETAIKCFEEIYKEEGKVTKYSLAKKAEISLRNSQEWLFKLRKKRFIIVSKPNRYIHSGKSIKGFLGRTPAEYVLR